MYQLCLSSRCKRIHRICLRSLVASMVPPTELCWPPRLQEEGGVHDMHSYNKVRW